MKAVGSCDLRDQLGSIHCPVLVVYGSRDAVMVAGGGMLAAGLPSAEVLILADVGHEPFVEAPDEAFAALNHLAALGRH
jgi:pimeloyl-ACP methyl ester carboxylesterase